MHGRTLCDVISVARLTPRSPLFWAVLLFFKKRDPTLVFLLSNVGLVRPPVQLVTRSYCCCRLFPPGLSFVHGNHTVVPFGNKTPLFLCFTQCPKASGSPFSHLFPPYLLGIGTPFGVFLPPF